MDTHLKVLSESYPIDIDMAGFTWFSNVFVLWTKVASALEELRNKATHSEKK